MQCPQCQHENREGRRFCAECGATLALACSSCGFANEPDEKFCGGCGMPLGAPLAHEDHAVRACYAALRMQESVQQYAEEIFSTHGIRPQIRVGLNSGEVVVRSIRSDLHMDYTAVGQTTHLAARMEQTALPGSILLASETLHLAEGYVQVRMLGPVAIKGLDQPVAVYEALGMGAARSRLQAAAARGLT